MEEMLTNIGKNVIGVGILVLAVAFCSAVYAADDIVKVAPQNCKVLLENENVRVLEYTAKAGEKIAMHSHPNHIVYVLSEGGTTKFTGADGKTVEREMKMGDTVWVEAGSHATEHMDVSRALIVELKK